MIDNYQALMQLVHEFLAMRKRGEHVHLVLSEGTRLQASADRTHWVNVDEDYSLLDVLPYVRLSHNTRKPEMSITAQVLTE